MNPDADPAPNAPHAAPENGSPPPTTAGAERPGPSWRQRLRLPGSRRQHLLLMAVGAGVVLLAASGQGALLPYLAAGAAGAGLHRVGQDLARRLRPQREFPTDLVSQDISTLQQAFGVLTQQVNATIQTSETAVLAMADRLSRVHLATARMHEQMHEAVSHSEKLSAESAARVDQQASTLAELAEHEQRFERERQTLITRVRASAEEVRKLMPLTTLIGEIARQTNMLAINAAIEAARAGAEGAGFKVVAGEVRRLSAETARAAREVSEGITAAVRAISDEAGLLEARMGEGASAQLSEVAGHVQGLVGTLSEVLPYMDQLTHTLDRDVEQVTADILDTLGDMQFQDINRQLLEQINHALGELSTHFAQVYQLIDGQAPPPPVQLEQLLQTWTQNYVMHAQRVAHAVAAGARRPSAEVIPLPEPPPLELAVANGPRIQLF